MTKAKSETAATETKPTAGHGRQRRKAQKKNPSCMSVPRLTGLASRTGSTQKYQETCRNCSMKRPELKNLFIPVREYPTACRMLREHKGYIYSAFMRALDFKNGGK